MGGPCELQGYASSELALQAAFDRAEAEVRRLEARYSRYRDDSELSRINRGAGGVPVAVDDETAALLDFAAVAWQQSDGAFDVTSGVLREAWNFKSGAVPSPDRIAALVGRIGWGRVDWTRPMLRLPAGMELDFGGFVKEYAADCACRVLRDAGVAHGLVDLGGDLAIAGAHPDGTPWSVGIRHPRNPDMPIAAIELGGGAIATSGDYERFFESGGRRYCHILDARSGWPVNGQASVSVVASHCLVAGAAATIAMLKGPGAGPEWLAGLGLAYLCIDAGGAVRGSLAAAG